MLARLRRNEGGEEAGGGEASAAQVSKKAGDEFKFGKGKVMAVSSSGRRQK